MLKLPGKALDSFILMVIAPFKIQEESVTTLAYPFIGLVILTRGFPSLRQAFLGLVLLGTAFPKQALHTLAFAFP